MTQPDPNAQSGTDSGQSTGDGQGQDTGTASGTNSGTQSGTETQDTGSPTESVTRAEFDALRTQLRTADQKRQEAEKRYKDLVEKDLPEQEKLKSQLAEAQAEADKAKEELKTARLKSAFLESNKYKWKNPATALKLADLSAVEIGDDGTVRGLTAALDALAKSDPYLIDKDDEGAKDQPKGSTGAPSTGGKPADAGNLKSLASRIPALRTRGIGQ